MLLMLDMKSGVILELELVMKSKGLFNKKLKSEILWDLTSEVLTELSQRDGVSYRVKATESSVKRKLEVLNG
tara:strand:- start:291 stop:506 length:216 start_codon:yes stop_codon:yes gene_type:complete